tara:strand:+ start:999 stop:1619 length:621 start_codon:yes stop_codon:yes gene_type:complete
MTQDALKALVKEYFNLTEIKMGELYDENKAFKIVFEGDKLELGMKVMVVTEEGQELDAPDGYHKLEDGSMIKTEGSVVTEITSAAEETKEEEMALPTEEFPVEVTTEDQTKVADESSAMPQMMAEEDKTTVEDIVSAVAEVVKREIADVKAEMGKMKEKMEKMSAEPAAEKTLPNTKMSAESTASNAVDPVRFEMMKKLISNKIKK